MPSSTRPATAGPSNVSQSSKRTMSDAESTPQDPKKARRNSSAEPSNSSNRDTRRRRRRKKKAPVVSAGAAKNEVTQSRLDERSRAPLSVRNEIIRFTSAPSEADLPASIVSATKPSSSSEPLSKSREGSSHTLDDIAEHRSQDMPVRTTKSLICRNAYLLNRVTRSGLFQQIDLSLRLPLVHWRMK